MIYASHVLEHVPDDRKAMRELHRVLRRGGWAVLQVPVWRPTTTEDPTVTDPKERERLFGQSDHVRMYGHDGEYERRLREAGFDVTVVPFVKELGPETARRYRLSAWEDIYFCARPGSRASRGTRPDAARAGLPHASAHPARSSDDACRVPRPDSVASRRVCNQRCGLGTVGR